MYIEQTSSPRSFFLLVGSCSSIFSFCVVFCRSWFVLFILAIVRYWSPLYKNPQSCSVYPRVVDRGSPSMVSGVKSYDRESMTVDHSV